MNTEITLSSSEYGPDVAALLTQAELPTEDLSSDAQTPASTVSLFAAHQQGALVATVALELYGQHALLRSLAVAEHKRGSGLGELMLEYAEQQARSQGVASLYLLTTTAQAFFAQRAYIDADRDSAPAAIAACRQFSGICPGSAAFMCKPLDS